VKTSSLLVVCCDVFTAADTALTCGTAVMLWRAVLLSLPAEACRAAGFQCVLAEVAPVLHWAGQPCESS
jgi:hypothetical protein